MVETIMPQEVENGDGGGQKRERRKIAGNLPYTTSAGVLKNTLEKLPDAEKPNVFNTDFLGAVLGVTGGSARPIPPILKAVGFLNQSGAPTELYSNFQTQSGRANAALQALKTGFPEIFKRNQYANRLDEKGLVDVIVAVTGLPRSDKVVRAILNTFQVFQAFSSNAREEVVTEIRETKLSEFQEIKPKSSLNSALGLVYNINVVPPETTNVEVYNAIFRSVKENLLS